MNQVRSPLLLVQALSPRERVHLAVPWAYWVAAAREQHRWLLAGLGFGSGVDVTAGSAEKRRRQRADMRMRRTVFLQQARQQRDRVQQELALHLGERGLAVPS